MNRDDKEFIGIAIGGGCLVIILNLVFWLAIIAAVFFGINAVFF
jgi:hypothetical protein